MTRIAVTGGIACGKSTVGSLMASQGAVLFDCDEIVHELMKPGERIHHEIVAEFGKDILDANGAVDRARLAERVFSDPYKLNLLNSIVHPEVKRAWRKWLEDQVSHAVVIVPLLYEVNEGENWDTVVCVSSSEDVQIRRLKDCGLSESDARKRIAAQMPISKKEEMADFVISNNSLIELLREQTLRVWRNIMES